MKQAIALLAILICTCLAGCSNYQAISNEKTLNVHTKKETITEVNLEGIDENGGILHIENYVDFANIHLIEQNYYYDEETNEIYKREDIYHYAEEKYAKKMYDENKELPGITLNGTIIKEITMDLHDTENAYSINADNYEALKGIFTDYRKEDLKQEGAIEELIKMHNHPIKLVVEFIKN